MKKTLFILLVLGFAIVSKAQSGKYLNAYTFYTNYLEDRKNTDALKSALENIQIAVKDEDFSKKAKGWYYYGAIHQELYLSETLKSNYPDAIFETVDGYMKALDLVYTGVDKKLRDKDKAIDMLGQFAGQLHNDGSKYYDSQENDELGIKYFAKVLEIKAFADKNGFSDKIIFDTNNSKFVAAIMALRSEQEAQGVKWLNELKAINFNNVFIYTKLADIAIKNGQEAEAMAIYDEGMKQYPDDVNIVIAKINIYLSSNRQTEALDMMHKAIELDTANPQLYFALGTTYGQLKDNDKAKANYEKAIEIDPNYRDAYNNIAAIYMDQANAIIEKMNNLSFGAADQKKYEQYEKERNALYEQALPYLEKSYSIKTESADSSHIVQTVKALQQIYAKMGNYAKSNEMKAKLKELGQ